jgi:RimJ/RimL family protein N-acetyltransferase
MRSAHPFAAYAPRVLPPSSSRRVRIVQLPPETLAALADGDLDAANRSSPVPLPPVFVGSDWQRTWRYRAVQVLDDPASAAWVTGVIWDPEAGVAVGRAGFHGPPDSDGMVEVGYAVDPARRRQGYGRAALLALLERAAADQTVRVVRASVSPGNVASLGLIASFGFVQVGEQWDEDDGLELVYEVTPDNAVGGWA